MKGVFVLHFAFLLSGIRWLAFCELHYTASYNRKAKPRGCYGRPCLQKKLMRAKCAEGTTN